MTSLTEFFGLLKYELIFIVFIRYACFLDRQELYFSWFESRLLRMNLADAGLCGYWIVRLLENFLELNVLLTFGVAKL